MRKYVSKKTGKSVQARQVTVMEERLPGPHGQLKPKRGEWVLQREDGDKPWLELWSNEAFQKEFAAGQEWKGPEAQLDPRPEGPEAQLDPRPEGPEAQLDPRPEGAE